MFGNDRQRFTYKPTAFGIQKPAQTEPKERRDMSLNKEELLEDLYDIILKHKKEIKKVPIASHINTAGPWAAKRGLVAAQKDLDNDGHPETVVYDKRGVPMIVNGYQLVPSDYPIRHEYYATHAEPLARARQSMREWVRDDIYEATPDPANKWRMKSIKHKDAADRLAAWDGYRMPSKPKKKGNPYSIFSKLIAPMVKRAFYSAWFQEKLGVANVQPACYYARIINKIISPIHIYRWLYLRLVEQKHYFNMKAEQGSPINTYKEYKKFMKTERGKRLFATWFENTMLAGATKEKFNPKEIKDTIVNDNLINGTMDVDGADPNDGFVHLLGPANMTGEGPTPAFEQGGTSISLMNVLQDDTLAEAYYNLLEDSDHPANREAKYGLAVFKEVAKESVKNLLSAEGIEAMMENPAAYQTWLSAIRASGGKNQTAATEEGLAEAGIDPDSPANQRQMQLMEKVDAAEEKDAEDQAALDTPPKEKGQKGIKGFFQTPRPGQQEEEDDEELA